MKFGMNVILFEISTKVGGVLRHRFGYLRSPLPLTAGSHNRTPSRNSNWNPGAWRQHCQHSLQLTRTCSAVCIN